MSRSHRPLRSALVPVLLAGLLAVPSSVAADDVGDTTGDVCADVDELEGASCSGSDAAVDIRSIDVEIDGNGTFDGSVLLSSLDAEEVVMEVLDDGTPTLTVIYDTTEGGGLELLGPDGTSANCLALFGRSMVSRGADVDARFWVAVASCIDLDTTSTYEANVTVRRSDGGVELADRAPNTGSEPVRVVPARRVISDTCRDRTGQVFDDVEEDPSAPHATNINCIADYGIAGGFPDGTFRPSARVTAGQIALFLTRTLDEADAGLPPSSTCGSGSAAPAVGQLVDAGILDDCDAQFDATRTQMASWVAASLRLAGVDLTPSRDWFEDDTGSTGAADHDGLADLGVVLGTGDGLFRPGENLTRGQMGTFLARALDALLEER